MSNIISERVNQNIYNEEIINRNWGNCKYKFNIFKNISFIKYKHLISVSLFILPDVDEVYANQKNITINELRVEHENKTSCYINGVETIITRCGEFNVRIYCDSSSIRNVENHLRYKNVEIVYFQFDQFYDFERRCHIGFFGTLMRYIPLFNFGIFNNKWSTVSVLDLENNFYNAKRLINYFIKEVKNINLMYWTRPCYYLSNRMFSINMKIKNFAIISSLLIQRKQQDKKIFINFLNNCLLGESEEYNNVLRSYLSIDFGSRIFGGKLEYGVDEYFINYYFLNDCYLTGNNRFYVIMYKDVSGGFLEWIKNMRLTIPRRKVSNENITRDFLEIIVKTFYPPDTILPDLPINDLVDWVGEKYYKMNLQYQHRKVDQTNLLLKFVEKIREERFHELDLYNEYLEGLELDVLLKNNIYTVFSINPNPIFPEFTCSIVGEVSRG